MAGNGSNDIDGLDGKHRGIGQAPPNESSDLDVRSSSPREGAPVNPFSASSVTPNERGVFGNARRIRSGFLYRVIDLDPPRAYRIIYDGWWFRQKIEINGVVSWFQISWLTIERRVDFRIPASIDPEQPDAALEIEFTRGLMIRRFRIWIGGQIVYDEIN